MFPTQQIQFMMLVISYGLFTEHISEPVFSASMLQQGNIHVAQGYVFKTVSKLLSGRLGCVLILRKVYLAFIFEPHHT